VKQIVLHFSKKEQKRRFLGRLEDPEKNWKFSANDIKGRAFWDDYKEVHEKMIQNTATLNAPCHVVLADNRWFTRVVVAAFVIDALASLKLHHSKVSVEKVKKLAVAKRSLLG
jgi:polyphosphate kinase 2 (PPK2 family)